MSDKKGTLVIILLPLSIGIVTAGYLHSIDDMALIYYSDSISHLVRARQLVESSNPGLEELGTVWLPLPHLILLPFSLVDLLFKSGLAGTLVSLPSIAITAAILYKMIKEQIDIPWIASLGASLYFLNPNILYLGITAMTEAIFMLFFVISAFYFQRFVSSFLFSSTIGTRSTVSATNCWCRTHGLDQKLLYPQALLKCSIFVALATLSRYEAWPISISIAVLGTLYGIKIRKDDQRKRKGSILYNAKGQSSFVVVCILVSLSGIIFWISYNWIYYANPLEFIVSPYFSAMSKALEGENRETLYLQPLNVASIYGLTALVFFGPSAIAGAVVGYTIHRKYVQKEEVLGRELTYLFLSIPSITSFLTLLFGIGEMNQWWYNSRFLIMLSPLIILFLAVFVRRTTETSLLNRTILAGSIAAVFLIYPITILILGGTVTWIDAKNSASYETRPYAMQTAKVLSGLYNGGKILIVTGSAQQNIIMHASSIPLTNFQAIHEGSDIGHQLKSSASNNNYLIISKKPDSSSKRYAESLTENQYELEKFFDKVYENSYYLLFARNDSTAK
jgi:hypothetical protein